MQQLYLTGVHAPELADRLFTALNIHPAGYRLTPFTVGGGLRGEALHLLPPAVPLDNDVPCRIRLHPASWTTVPRVLSEVAAPALLRLAAVRMPILLGFLDADMLTCAPFREAVVTLLHGHNPVIVAADDKAEETLRALAPAEDQLWMAVPQEADAQDLMLEQLLAEAAMRL